jgi:hypothetical protein
MILMKMHGMPGRRLQKRGDLVLLRCWASGCLCGRLQRARRATCEVYLPDTDRWESVLDALAAGGLGLATVGGQLYAVGGGWEGYLGFSERYNPVDDVWSVLESPLVGEWRNLGLVSWETSLYAVGGWSGDYLNLTYKLEVLPFRVFIPVSMP